MAGYRAELECLYDAGLRNVQIGDPTLKAFVLELFRAGFAAEALIRKTPSINFLPFITLCSWVSPRICILGFTSAMVICRLIFRVWAFLARACTI